MFDKIRMAIIKARTKPWMEITNKREKKLLEDVNATREHLMRVIKRYNEIYVVEEDGKELTNEDLEKKSIEELKELLKAYNIRLNKDVGGPYDEDTTET